MIQIQPIRFCTLALVLGMVGSPAYAQTLDFGVVPQQVATQALRVWTPLLKAIEQQTGIKLNFRTTVDIPTFEGKLISQEYDLAYMNPYHFTVVQEQGFQAIAKAKDRRLKGIIVTRKDSTLTDIQELNDMKLAFPAPAAFAATVLPAATLRQQGVKFTPSYVGSHDSVYIAVSKGLYPAGGGIHRTFNNISEETRSKLKILWETKGYTPHAIAASPKVLPETIRILKNAFSKLCEDEQYRPLFKTFKTECFVPANDADWDDIRSLKIDLPIGLGSN